MKKNKTTTYWDEVKDKPTHYSGGAGGYEVHLITRTYTDHNKKTVTRKEFEWPYNGPDRRISRSEMGQIKIDVRNQHKLHKLLAKSSSDYEEYKDLKNRIYNNNLEFDFVFAIKLKGVDFAKYIRANYLTRSEAERLSYM